MTIVAGHKGHPTTVKKKDEKDDAIDSKAVERGTLAGEKPPILGRGVCIQMLENVQQKTIEPLIKKALIPGRMVELLVGVVKAQSETPY